MKEGYVGVVVEVVMIVIEVRIVLFLKQFNCFVNCQVVVVFYCGIEEWLEEVWCGDVQVVIGEVGVECFVYFFQFGVGDGVVCFDESFWQICMVVFVLV